MATIIASMMTAANLGPRITGWGFVVFTIGSIGWVTIALATGQQNLLLSNLFLTIVNLIGIWRWLGREAKLNDGAVKAREHSESLIAPTLFSAAAIIGGPVVDRSGSALGTSAGAMIAAGEGRIAYCVVREGGIGGVGERLHAIPWNRFDADGEQLTIDMTTEELTALPTIEADHWPAAVPAID